MDEIVLIFHLILAIALVISVLLQRSEGGALGIGGGNMGGLMTARGSASMLTRATGVIATAFICTSLVLAIIAANESKPGSIMDKPAPASSSEPAKPQGPAVPMGR